jgi:phosphopantetheinyl transferase
MFFCLVFNANRWLPNEQEWSALMRLIGDTERVRIERFKRPAPVGGTALTGRENVDAKQSLVGRVLLLHVVSRQLGCRLSDVRLTRSAYGKPIVDVTSMISNVVMHDDEKQRRLRRLRSIGFNIAHHGELVCLLVADAAGASATPAADDSSVVDVGVDIVSMTLPTRTSTASLAEQQAKFFESFESDVFTDAEWQTIRHCSSSTPAAFSQRSIDLFFIHWALKEAYVKLLGRGIGFGLCRIDFQLCYDDDDDDDGRNPLRSVVMHQPVSSLSKVFSLLCSTSITSSTSTVTQSDSRRDYMPRFARVRVDGELLTNVKFALLYGFVDVDNACFVYSSTPIAFQSDARQRALYCVACALSSSSSNDVAFQCLSLDSLQPKFDQMQI